MKLSWKDADLRTAVLKADSLTDVLYELGLVPAGGNFVSIHKHIVRLGLSTDHFTRTRNRGRRERKPVDIFVKNSTVTHVAWFVRKFSVIPYVCQICNNPGVHNGQPLTLQVDHCNGDRSDNRLSNLRYLCPNCHTQTSNYAGKNVRKRTVTPRHQREFLRVSASLLAKRYMQIGVFSQVAKEFNVTATTVREAVKELCPLVAPNAGARYCVRRQIRESKIHVNNEQLAKLVWEEPSQVLASRIGVSDSALSKHCKKHSIPKPSRGYWAKKAANKI